jgi:hypothetical protein
MQDKPRSRFDRLPFPLLFIEAHLRKGRELNAVFW